MNSNPLQLISRDFLKNMGLNQGNLLKGTKVIYLRVLSSGFSLFQLETKTTFYKQCWPYSRLQFGTILFLSVLLRRKHTVRTINDVLSRSTPLYQKGVDRLD